MKRESHHLGRARTLLNLGTFARVGLNRVFAALPFRGRPCPAHLGAAPRPGSRRTGEASQRSAEPGGSSEVPEPSPGRGGGYRLR